MRRDVALALLAFALVLIVFAVAGYVGYENWSTLD